MMCAGVQNVSRPIDICQAISHGPPIIPLTTPATMHQIVHGTDSTRATEPTRADMGGLAICCPKGMDCPITRHSSAAATSDIFSALPRVYTPPHILQTTSLQPRHLLPNYVIISILLRLETRWNIQAASSSFIVRAMPAISFFYRSALGEPVHANFLRPSEASLPPPGSRPAIHRHHAHHSRRRRRWQHGGLQRPRRRSPQAASLPEPQRTDRCLALRPRYQHHRPQHGALQLLHLSRAKSNFCG